MAGIGARKSQRASTGVLDAAAVFKIPADQSGATAIEYCLIAVGISIVILVAVNGIGTSLNTKFTSVNSSLK
jgi:pilus assembly protein Flp/PilA